MIGLALATRTVAKTVQHAESRLAAAPSVPAGGRSAAPIRRTAAHRRAVNSVVASHRPNRKLQGIIYDATRPSAIVDGKTVYVGDQRGRISREGKFRNDSVTLDKADGHRKTLGFGE